jgi:hypothetical protein
MDCRRFREQHVGYVDDTLPAVEMEAMHQHVRVCRRCARHDTALRRGLLLVRNLPTIEPSSDFMARLHARLQELKAANSGPFGTAPARTPSLATFAALAAGVALAAYVAFEMVERSATTPEIRLPPVVATAPEPTPAGPLENSAIVAAISTGMPVWPAVLMADQAPTHLANVEFQQAALR